MKDSHSRRLWVATSIKRQSRNSSQRAPILMKNGKMSSMMTTMSAGSTHIWVVTTSTVSRSFILPLHRTYVRLVRAIARAHFVTKLTRLYADKYKKGVDFPIRVCYHYIVKREIEVGGWFSKKFLRKVEITS